MLNNSSYIKTLRIIKNGMKRSLIFLWLTLNATQLFSQELYNPDSLLVGKDELPKILLVGCYHFAYYNFDAHKTDEDKQVDVLSVKRQKEMDELVNYIARFKPTKVIVESDSNTTGLMNLYRAYATGTGTLGKDEREQIGFRLMKQFGLDTIYGADANSVADEMFDSPDSSVAALAQTVFKGYDYQSDDLLSMRYNNLYNYEDSLKLQTTMLEYFKHLNSDKMLSREYGAYLVGDFNLRDYHGADALSLYWYNRNLRIYRNIQRITDSGDDRVVVIFGSGHVQILKQLVESSPEFQLVKFNDL